MRYFDYERVVRDAGIRPDQLAALEDLVRREFPSDEMMHELHVMRVCMAVREGHATVEEVLQSELAHAA